jgi:hypothetical protein
MTLWCEVHFQIKIYKIHQGRTIFESYDVGKVMSLWGEAHFEVKIYKIYQLRTIFRSCDVEKVHAVVARSTFASKKAESTSRSERLWKLRRRKGARRCGMLWREALFEVKMHITHHARTTFGS